MTASTPSHFALVGHDHRDTAAARRDDDVAPVDESGGDLDASHGARLGRRDDLAPAAPGVLDHRPTRGLLLRTRRGSCEKNGPTGLDGFRNAGSAASTSTCVMIVTTCLRNPARGSSLSNASSSRNPIEPFRLRHAEVERLRRDLVRGLLGLDQDVPDLRPVAVDDDQLVSLADDRDELSDGFACALELLGRRARVLRAQQRVASEGDDGERPDEGEERSRIHRPPSAVCRLPPAPVTASGPPAPGASSCSGGRRAPARARGPRAG